MTNRAAFIFAIVLLIAAALFASAATIFDPPVKPRQEGRLIVHEWGTFTSISTADGRAQIWSPLVGPSELPAFVYRSEEARQNRCLKCVQALVRMETPVLYFYADREMDVSVNVGFPRGRITEWYPRAHSANREISWSNFKVLPHAQAKFPLDQSQSHYYSARETDAAPVGIGEGQRAEYEKFLFYRGIGDFDLPLNVKLAGDQVSVRGSGRDEIAQVILFENRDGRAGWRIYGSLNGETTMTRPVLGQPVELLHSELEKSLVSQGLYEKEARAMVKTWSDSWFEEGLRVIYIVPRRVTDEILPITITPTPSQLSRVLVGRAEIVTPEMELALRTAAEQFREESSESRQAAIKSVRRYGRFAEPVLREMMRRSNNNTADSPIWKLIVASIEE